MKNTQTAFGGMAKSLHWLSALIVLALLSVGFYMVELGASPFKIQLYGLHKSFGLLVLFLVVGRILWRLTNVTPKPLPSHHLWERVLSSIIHVLLYAGLIGMPLSGWLMSSAGDYPAPFFGLFDMPDLVGKDRDLFQLMRDAHNLLAYGMILAIALHFAGAVKHHFVDKDDTLKRMTSSAFGGFAAMFLVLVMGAMLASGAYLGAAHYVSKAERQKARNVVVPVEKIEAQQEEVSENNTQWVIDQSQSAINFTATQYGQTFEGEFERFDGKIVFDPDNLGASKANIIIDITSIKTGSADRDEQALDPEWFHTAEFPKAHFETKEFYALGANRYEAIADLTIRNTTKTVKMTFTLDIKSLSDNKAEARMNARLTIDRLNFSVGQGQWESAEAIGAQVNLEISVVAHQ